MDRVKRTMESERLRSALLTSISHDLKTPLASVLGAASTMRDLSSGLSEQEKHDLLATVIDESERLNRFIANLLDMTKLESGAVVPNLALHDVGEVVGSALRRATKILAQHRVALDFAAELPMLQIDAVLFEQVLFNLLDNAAKYSQPGSAITMRSYRDGTQFVLEVADEGEGIPDGEVESVFDKFYRVQKSDHVRPGTGLGLAISRGFIEAMHGRIFASNRRDRSGAVLTIRLPIPAGSKALDTAA
jgi:two-component system sensor histidine kinase KdpD